MISDRVRGGRAPRRGQRVNPAPEGDDGREQGGARAVSEHSSRELSVRQHERHECDAAGWVRVSREDARRVVLSRQVAGDAGTVACRVVDFSAGGLGIRTGVLLPRGCRVEVEMEGSSGRAVAALKVRRAVMVDRTPMYYLGLSYMVEGDREAIIEALSGAGAG
jgi:hypothetical protein